MGNVCGCVRVPKEECYVNPKKAPLNPEATDLKGRRYFQRKKRKSESSHCNGSIKEGGKEEFTSATCGGERQVGIDESLEDKPSQEKLLSRQHSIREGVYVGEVPVLNPGDTWDQPRACGLERFSTISDRSRSNDRGQLGLTSSGSSPKDGLLVRKLLQGQLRRAVSFGAVEHTLHTLSGTDRPGSEETLSLAQIIWGSQVHRRRRRRAHTCSGYVEHLPAPAKCISAQDEVNQECVIYSHQDS